jgi:superfamily I DNA/RNA helicase
MPSAKEMDYLLVLKALNEIPFGVGRKLLIDFLQGVSDNESIARNRLNKKDGFGSMAYDKEELGAMIDNLLLNGMIDTSAVNGNRFWKVMELSAKGRRELDAPSLYKRKLAFSYKEPETVVTDEEKRLFSSLGEEYARYNDAQKKAIVSGNKHVLCVAGAGSGKTTVLVKRIEFLVKYRSVDPAKVLAVTFTRKARQEMMNRLSKMGGMEEVHVETFNSFCEKMLRRHENAAYDKQMRVVMYRDKVMMTNKALQSMDISMGGAIQMYFSYAQQRMKTDEQLANIFMNDCFFVRDYFKFKNKQIEIGQFDFAAEDEKVVKLVVAVCNFIEAYMKEKGLRDFADQLMDCLALLDAHPELVPGFDHVLVDEYQDVNSTQIRLLDVLDPLNMFCVGDPRQSIYGWRGSDVRYGCEVVTLTKNYRSSKHIVELVNSAIKSMGLADLESAVEGERDIKLLKFDSEDAEFEFVVQRILAAEISRGEIFVLARTNRQLNELSQIMKSRGISHVVRSDELRKSVVAGEDDVTLATVHAIKGMEAEMVFVVGCTMMNFPCKGSEHPVMEMVKVEEYDKEEEERRLFYVAMSRARKSLYLSYGNKKPTLFVTKNMLGIIDSKSLKLTPGEAKVKIQKGASGGLLVQLREWRREKSQKLNVPAYIIMQDRTMEEIADKMPLNSEELKEVTGMGPVKVLRYGEEILGLVNK